MARLKTVMRGDKLQQHDSPASFGEQEEPVISNQVKSVRRQKGLSRGEVADAVGLNPRTLGYIEYQRRSADTPLSTVYKLADYLGAEPHDLFYRAERPPQPTSPYEPEPPETVQEYAGGRRQARILVTILDRGPLEKRKIEESTKVSAQELGEYLADLLSAGLLQTTENELALFRKEEKPLFGLTPSARDGLAQRFRKEHKEG